MQVRKLSEAGGIEIEGVELARLDSQESREVCRLFDEHGLVLFKKQKLTKQQLIATGVPFGGAMTDPPGAGQRDAEAPGILTISTRGAGGNVVPTDGNKIVGDIEWHTDQAYVANPNRGKILYAVQVPDEGGMTGFIDGQATYAALSEDMRKRLADLHVIHSLDHAQAAVTRNKDYKVGDSKTLSSSTFPDLAFPMIYNHPVTGAKVLHVPPLWCAGIVEMPGAEGKALIAELTQHVTQQRFQYWHRYDVGDAVLWDNWRFMHAAGGTPGRHVRTMWSFAISPGAIALGLALPKAA
jgi:taurine dioxygenase